MTPLERAARALARLSVHDESQFPYISKSQAELNWPAFVENARAVIEAIQEPSEGMIESAERLAEPMASGGFYSVDYAKPEATWSVMIKHILEEDV